MFSTDFIINAIRHLTRLDVTLAIKARNSFKRIHTDSRTIQSGDFFIPLKGDTFDGHAYIEMALQKGAQGFFYSDSSFVPKNHHALGIAVPDVLAAYRELAKAWRLQFTNTPVIAVAGSVGKTTTKELIAACLTGKYSGVLSTTDSQNGFVGVALTLLELRPQHQVAVIEIGIDEPLAMKKHLDVVRPDYSIVTALGPEHLETLKDIETVAIEETEALRFCMNHTTGRAILNADEPDLKKYLGLKPEPLRAYSYGVQTQDTPWPGLEHFSAQLPFTLICGPWKGESFTNPTQGAHNARNLLGAITLCYALGLSANEIRAGLKNFRTPKGRSDLRTLKNGVMVLADFYNSNPTSLTAALDTLLTLKGKKHIACLGDMLELGPDEHKFHSDMSLHPAFKTIDAVFLFGPRMKSLEQKLKQSHKKLSVNHFLNHADLARELSPFLKEETVVLIKGSRGMKMEALFGLCPELSELSFK